MLAAGNTLPPAAGQTSVLGQWSSVIPFPVVPIHQQMLPTGKVMFFGRGGDPYLWDPGTGSYSSLPLSGYNIFCSGHSFLADGRVLITGGHVVDGQGLPNASIYDPFLNSWTRLPNMSSARWYPSNTMLANGEVLVISGSVDSSYTPNDLPQVWQRNGTWRSLTTARLSLPNYPYNFLAPNGKVFNAGPSQTTRYLDTAGTGAWSTVANNTFGLRDYGTAVMYDTGKVLIIGGHDPPTATAEVINLNAATPTWRSVPSMSIARRHLNGTLLPDGKVLIVGGTSGTGFDNHSTPVYTTELWDPATERFTLVASAAVPRWYHSNALLLPDGRVLATGGEETPSGEVYSPYYLFKGARPTISSAPSSVQNGQTFFVGSADAASITNVNWLRIGAPTHTTNMDQRINRLSFSQASGGLNIIAPSDSNVTPPGHYMLFLLNGSGVPSVARILQVTGAGGPSAPTSLAASAVASDQINLSWAEAATNEDGFQIERSTNGSAFTVIGSVGPNVTTYASKGLFGQTTYYYRVLAYNSAGASSYSNTANATTAADGSALLSDNFNDNTRDTSKWSFGTIAGAVTSASAWDTAVPVLEQNQRLEIAPRATVTGLHYNGYVSAATWNFTNANLSVEVVQTSSGTADTGMVIGIDAKNFYLAEVEGGRLYFTQVVAGARSETSVVYSATTHHFWRIRHDASANTIVFETSPDRVTWTAQRTLTRQLTLTAMKVELGGGTWEGVASPGIAIFDDLRLALNSGTPPPTNQPPVARAGGPYSGTAGQPVAFNGSTSSDPDGSIVSYQWSFGDGGTATGATPSHTYAAAGSFTVTLTVTDNGGATGSTFTTAGITSGTPPPPASFSDDFNDNARDTAKWTLGAIIGTITAGPTAWDSTVPVLEQNQRLEITPRANVSGTHYNGYVSAATWDLTNANASEEVVQATTGTANTGFAVAIDAKNFYLIETESGRLYFTQVVAGARTETSVVYNATTHRFWRIRHDPVANTIVFETSADRNSWTTQRTVTRQLAITALKIELTAGTWQAVSAPGKAIFENFRLAANN
jgi:PKD repeat protein